ncbi:TolC family protein [Planctellipticum variicoloris]|uniref:TolC family protein n=1 Tax=Planctellipticum variicoloris TaxID=3064265 RepID=UPI0030135B74|nr:TolC family protein [Planctomycetaceae bacterium SH412]
MGHRILAGLLSLYVVALSAGCAQTSAIRIGKSEPRRSDARAGVGESDTSRLSVKNKSLNTEAGEIQLTSSEEPPLVPAPTEAGSGELSLEHNSGSVVLTLAELESLALQNNPTLSQAGAAVDQEWGAYRQSGLYPNPQIGYLNTSANQSAPKQSNGVFLSQEFVTAKKIPLSQAADSQEVKRLQWDQEAQRMRVINDLRIRYYEVLGAQKAVAVNRQLVSLSEESLSTAEKQFLGKSVPKTDVLQAQVLVNSSRITLAEANHRLEAAWEQLATMAGVPSLPVTTLSEPGNDEIPDLDLESQWQQLLAESPQLKSAESELDHGWAALRQSEAQAIPNVTVQVVADYDRVTQSTTASTLVALPLPIFNRNQGNIDKAMADVRVDQADVARVQLVLRDQLADSFRRYKSSRVQAETLTKSILPASEENLKLTMAAYKGGEVGFRDVLFAQEAFAQSQIARIEAVTEAQKVAVEIAGLQLTGGLNPAAIGSAIQTQGGGGSRQRALLQEVQDRAAKQLLPAAQIGR